MTDDEFHQRELAEVVSEAKTTLTPRELEVVNLFEQGFNQAEIAEQLGISAPRVRAVLNNINDKWGHLKEFL